MTKSLPIKLLIAVFTVLSLSACSDSDNDDGGGNGQTNVCTWDNGQWDNCEWGP